MAKKIRNALAPGTQIADYKIEKVLGQGGFGITYLGEDVNLEKKVAIKEYLPVGLAVREADDSVQPQSTDAETDYQYGLDQFLGEAKTLAKFHHPNIVQVLRFFEANGTAYIVMNFVEGVSLHDRMTKRKGIDEEELRRFLFPLLDGLEKVHDTGFLHRDIKPGNIFISNDGQPMLLDFGAARAALKDKSRSLTAIVTRGYAPIEQYSSRGNQGPWTDIYALAGVLYEIVAGEDPLEATDRVIDDPMPPAVEAGEGRLSETMLAAIDHALAVRPEHRPQTVAEWRAELLGDAEIPEPVPLSKKAPPRTSRVLKEDAPKTSKVPAAKKTESPSAERRARSRPKAPAAAKPAATEAVPAAAETIMVDEPGAQAKEPRPAGKKGSGGRTAMVAVAALLVVGIALAAIFLGRPGPGGDPTTAKLEFGAEERRLVEMVRRAAREHAARVVRNRAARKAAVSKQLVSLISGGQVSFIRNEGVGRHEARWTFHKNGRLEGAAFVSDGGGGDEMRSLSDRGKWWVKGNTLCVRWSQWDKGRTRCYAVAPAGRGRYRASGGGGVLAGMFKLEK